MPCSITSLIKAVNHRPGFIIIDSLTPRACLDLDLLVHVPMYYKSKLMHLKSRYHIVDYR